MYTVLFGAMLAEAVITHPLDVMRVRAQLGYAYILVDASTRLCSHCTAHMHSVCVCLAILIMDLYWVARWVQQLMTHSECTPRMMARDGICSGVGCCRTYYLAPLRLGFVMPSLPWHRCIWYVIYEMR